MQAKAVAFFARREAVLKKPLMIFRRDTHPRVRHGDDDTVGLRPLEAHRDALLWRCRFVIDGVLRPGMQVA